MDKDIVRIIIIAIGLLIIVGMLAWGYWRNQKVSNDMSIFDEDGNEHPRSAEFQSEFDDFDETEPLPPANPAPERYQFDTSSAPVETQSRFHPIENAMFPSADNNVAAQKPAKVDPPKPKAPPVNSASKQHLPMVLQFSIVAANEEGFNGLDLLEVFQMVGLEYGSVKIFERLDFNRMVDFGVASMINPGTFPIDDMANFYTPGITFFMQPRELPDPVLVFDDLLRTINLIAKELNGIKWDAERKPLNEYTVKTLRQSLQLQ